MELTVFDITKCASGIFRGEIDMEIGDSDSTNDFVVDHTVDMGECIAEIGGEFGGIVERLDNIDAKAYAGYTWRGLLDQWIMVPPDGTDRITVSGDINVVIKDVVRKVLGGFFEVEDVILGVLVWYYSFPLYCTVLEGLMKMCDDHGCKLVIKNKVVDKKLRVVLSAEKAEHKTISERAFFASTTINNMGINHLVCAGTGELKDRQRVHLYLWPDGSIKQNTPYYTGFLERQAFYEYTSQEDITELIKGGEKRLRELAGYKKMEFKTIQTDADVGDYLRAVKDGITIEEPVTRKILTGTNRNYTIEIKTKGDSQ